MHAVFLTLALLTPAQAPDPIDAPRAGTRPPPKTGADIPRVGVDRQREGEERPQLVQIPQLDGTWSIVALEVAGRPGPTNAAAVTIKGNVLTFGTVSNGKPIAEAARPGNGEASRTAPGTNPRTITSVPEQGTTKVTADMPQTWRLDFGAKNTIRAFPVLPGPGGTSVLSRATTGTGGTAGVGSSGVYVVSRDFLCISLDDSYAYKVGYSENPPPGPRPPTAATVRPEDRGPFVLILRRQGTEPATNGRPSDR
jgi:hypothetical protein